MGKEIFTLSIVVVNQFGVLSRVAGLFSKRGYNIDSIHTTVIGTSDYSRMIITAEGDDYAKDQIAKQLNKLYDVKSVEILK